MNMWQVWIDDEILATLNFALAYAQKGLLTDALAAGSDGDQKLFLSLLARTVWVGGVINDEQE